MEKKKSPMKAVIVILSILLILSLAALLCLLLCRCVGDRGPASVVIPDNLIDPTGGSEAPTDPSVPSEPTDATEPSAKPTTQATETTVDIYAGLGLYINANQHTDNSPFSVPNMFPGDSVERYYAVQVCYRETVTVHFRATVRPGYEKLAEVLMAKVELLNTGETLYDGLMRDMPAQTHRLTTAQTVDTQELFYRITVYLGTHVGNDYQNKALIADFDWWVEETENLEPPPGTGDDAPLLAATVAAGSCLLSIGIVLSRARRKGDADNEEE